MEPAVGAEALDAPEHRGAGNARLACFEHEPLVERLTVVFVALPQEDPEQVSIFGNGHASPRTLWPEDCSWPACASDRSWACRLRVSPRGLHRDTRQRVACPDTTDSEADLERYRSRGGQPLVV